MSSGYKAPLITLDEAVILAEILIPPILVIMVGRAVVKKVFRSIR